MPGLLCTAGARRGNGRFRASDLSNQTWGNPSKMWGGVENEKNIYKKLVLFLPREKLKKNNQEKSHLPIMFRSSSILLSSLLLVLDFSFL